MRRRIGAGVVVLAILAAIVAAQSAVAEIRGTVKDPAGTPLAGAKITLLTPPVRTTVTAADGGFRFTNVPIGTHTIRVELTGFSTMTIAVSVSQAESSSLDVRMAPAGLDERVTVGAAKRPMAAPQEATGSRDRAAVVRGGLAGGPVGGVATEAPARGARIREGAEERRRSRFNTEAYDYIDENGFRSVGTDPLSTFSIDVDTASYANARRFLTTGTLPPRGAVRIEEFINYFHFDYPQPAAGVPFSMTTELAACPWNSKHQLALIGLQGRDIESREPAPRNLVFLLDVSGSMIDPDKLPLVQAAMQMLTDILTARDRVAIVVYAGASGVALPSTRGDQKALIRRAIADLHAGGSTNGAAGIRLAYRIAREQFVRGGVNRVILATDGDFNVA